MQSTAPSQSLSMPSSQLVSLLGALPQSAGQLHWSSPAELSQTLSPQADGPPQSMAQLNESSPPSHMPSPQQ